MRKPNQDCMPARQAAGDILLSRIRDVLALRDEPPTSMWKLCRMLDEKTTMAAGSTIKSWLLGTEPKGHAIPAVVIPDIAALLECSCGDLLDPVTPIVHDDTGAEKTTT